MGGGAWPFLVGGAICLVNSVNERDLSLLTSYVENPVNHRVYERKLRPRPFGRGHVCLGVTHSIASQQILWESGGLAFGVIFE
ncbi:unnamed protein product [Victoria cruziana]